MSAGKIQAKYVEEALLPHNAINGSFLGDFETMDGVKVRLQFVRVFNNKDQYCYEDLDDYCLSRYCMSFNKYEAEWLWRLDGEVSDYWHIVKMRKI